MAKKKMVIQLPEKKKKIKETPEERAERIRLWPTTRTRVVPNKKKAEERKRSKEVPDYE